MKSFLFPLLVLMKASHFLTKVSPFKKNIPFINATFPLFPSSKKETFLQKKETLIHCPITYKAESSFGSIFNTKENASRKTVEVKKETLIIYELVSEVCYESSVNIFASINHLTTTQFRKAF